jgi:hypothetical protein
VSIDEPIERQLRSATNRNNERDVVIAHRSGA